MLLKSDALLGTLLYRCLDEGMKIQWVTPNSGGTNASLSRASINRTLVVPKFTIEEQNYVQHLEQVPVPTRTHL